MSEIDWLYELSPSMWCKDQTEEDAIPNFMKNCQETSTIARSELIVKKDLFYGTEPEQKIIITHDRDCPEEAPLLCFIHGGYWQAVTADESVGFALAVK